MSDVDLAIVSLFFVQLPFGYLNVGSELQWLMCLEHGWCNHEFSLNTDGSEMMV